MKLIQNIFFAVVMMVGSSCMAQEILDFVVVNDTKDSFVNLRVGASSKSKVERKLANGSVVYALEQKGDWTKVEFVEGENFIKGFVYKSFVTLIPTFKKIKANAVTANSGVFKGGNIMVTINLAKFVKDKHTYTYYKDSNVIDNIDGESAWGASVSEPTTQYKSITIAFGEQKIELPQAAIKNLFNPDLKATHVYYESSTDTLYITAVNDDGAAGYCVAFVIKGKKYIDRALDAPF